MDAERNVFVPEGGPAACGEQGFGERAFRERRAKEHDFVRTPKLAHIVADRLRRQIVTGELRPGDTLPREAQLMEHFGISRPALREALRILEAESLIAIGRGTRGGATILPPSIEKVAEYGTFCLIASGTTVHEVHDARALIEPTIVGQLARHPRPTVIDALRRCIADGLYAIDLGNLKSAILASNAFHECLIRFSENKAIGLLVGMLHDISVHSYSALDERWTDETEKRRRIGRAFKAMQRLTDLIEQSNADEAEAFWRAYMAKTADVLASNGHANDTLTLEQS